MICEPHINERTGDSGNTWHPLLGIPQLTGAHHIDIVVRRNGKDEYYEGDWLKQYQKSLGRGVEQIACWESCSDDCDGHPDIQEEPGPDCNCSQAKYPCKKCEDEMLAARDYYTKNETDKCLVEILNTCDSREGEGKAFRKDLLDTLIHIQSDPASNKLLNLYDKYCQ